jgi:murein L,D-transpeptidase YafK
MEIQVFKTVVILFITVLFLLLAYKILMDIQSPKPSKPITKMKKPSKRATQQNRTTQKKPVPQSTASESHTIQVPEMITDIVEKIAKPSPTEASLAEKIEAIGGRVGDPIFIRIFKEEAELEVWMKAEGQYQLIQTYPICAFSGELGPKQKEGDRQSPEGFYYVTKNRLNPNSRFHLSFNLGYPNRYDRAHGRTGSFLMVHGDCVSIGCYAMTDSKIEEIYELVEQALAEGQKIIRVHAFPFRMTVENMQRHYGDKWYNFWENLQEGYDWFEEKKIPPNVTVKQKKYMFD